MNKSVSIFAHKGFVGICVNDLTLDDDGNVTAVPDCLLNDPLDFLQIGVVANGAAVVISQEAYDIIAKLPQDDEGFPSFMCAKAPDEAKEDLPDVEFVVGWYGFLKVYLSPDDPIGETDLDLLKGCIGDAPVDPEFAVMIDEQLAQEIGEDAE